ncbi:hypothetical protein vseg_019547 [Gypsophila vaccaria]
MVSTSNDQLLHLEDALLQRGDRELYAGDGSTDYHGQPVLKSKTGNWRACPFILGNECCERLAYYSIAKNLVNYLTTKLHEGNVSAARNVNAWAGTCYLTPLIGAYLADAYWGRYWTIAVFSGLYFMGMCTLSISALFPALKPAECVGSICPEATPAQNAIFFGGLYLMALGTGGIKPCVSSFGADQFDDTDPDERIKKGSFFNWFYFSITIGSLLASSLVIWIQENVGWGIGFAIPAFSVGIAIISFFLGTPLYRFQRPAGSPLTRICQVIVASYHKRKLEVPHDISLLYETGNKHSTNGGSRKLEHTRGMMCLDKAAVLSETDIRSGKLCEPWRLCTVTQVEELKILIRILPIWATVIFFSAVHSQMATMFIEQGMVMDRTIGSFTIPAASLSIFGVISVIIWVPVYDRLLIPLARKFTGKEKGISDLQRIGIGLFISILAMVSSALLEIKRLQKAKEMGIVNENVAVELSIFWQIPQFCLVGAAEVFAFIGLMEFFYDQSPDGMRSLYSALALLTTAMANYLSSLILTIVTAVTTAGGKPGWIPDNLNQGQLYNFFWLLAGLSFLNLLGYAFCAMKYKQKHTSKRS